MKRSFITISIFILLNSVLLAGELEPVVVEKLGLEKTTIDGATVYYEACFVEKLGVFKKEYLSYKELFSDDDIEQFKSRKEEVYKEIETIAGKHEKLRDIFESTVEGMLKVSGVTQKLYIQEPTFFLIKKETIKNYLRQGGKVPNFTYDKESDTAEYMFMFDKETKVAELSIPLTSVEDFDSEIHSVFNMLTDLQTTILLDVIIHEICEMCLAMRLESKAPYLRWFRDGVAEEMTYAILHKHFGADKAESFLINRSVSKISTPENQVNLQYWLLLRYTIGNSVPIERESDLTIARYRYSFGEIKRLVDLHGIECITKIIDKFTDFETKDSDALYRAIRDVTGEDLQGRFKKYQTFGSKVDGLKFYVNKFRKSQEDNNPEAMLFNALRSFELHISPIHPSSWTTRKTISILLYRMGHKGLADEGMNDFVDYVSEFKIEQAAVDARRNFMAYAIATNRPELGYDYAREVLEINSKETISLAIVMLKYAKEKNFEEAKKTAQQICDIVPDESSSFNRMAKQILLK